MADGDDAHGHRMDDAVDIDFNHPRLQRAAQQEEKAAIAQQNTQACLTAYSLSEPASLRCIYMDE